MVLTELGSVFVQCNAAVGAVLVPAVVGVALLGLAAARMLRRRRRHVRTDQAFVGTRRFGGLVCR